MVVDVVGGVAAAGAVALASVAVVASVAVAAAIAAVVAAGVFCCQWRCCCCCCCYCKCWRPAAVPALLLQVSLMLVAQ